MSYRDRRPSSGEYGGSLQHLRNGSRFSPTRRQVLNARSRPVTPDVSLPSEQAILLSPRREPLPHQHGSPGYGEMSSPNRPRTVDLVSGHVASSSSKATDRQQGRFASSPSNVPTTPERRPNSQSNGVSPKRQYDPYTAKFLQRKQEKQQQRSATPTRQQLTGNLQRAASPSPNYKQRPTTPTRSFLTDHHQRQASPSPTQQKRPITPTHQRQASPSPTQQKRPTTPTHQRQASSSPSSSPRHPEDPNAPPGSFDPYNSALYRAALQSVHTSQFNRERRTAPNSTFHHFDNNQHAIRQPQKPALKRSASAKSADAGILASTPAWFRSNGDDATSSNSSTPSKSKQVNFSSNNSDPGGNGLSLGGEEQSIHAASWAPDNQYTLPQDALVMLKGGVVETHSAHMLAYASPILAQRLTPITHGRHRGKHRIEIANGDIEDWHALKPFLQPHSVQKATVTTQNFATLLPWFHELRIMVLLTECDTILSTLTFPDPGTEEPTTQDWHDLLLLSIICSRVHLPQTFQNSMKMLQAYLAKFPSLCTKGSNLQSMMELLRDCPPARSALWKSISSFLPVDLLVEYKESDDVERLVTNPLFPYLWREGLNKSVVKETDRDRDRDRDREQHDVEKERLRRWRERRRALDRSADESDEMSKYNSVLSEDPSFGEPDWMHTDVNNSFFSESKEGEEKDISDIMDEEASAVIRQVLNDTSFTSNPPKKELEGFAEWWFSWAHGQHGSDSDSGVLELESGEQPPERTVWLEGVLARVRILPLFNDPLPPLLDDALNESYETDLSSVPGATVVSRGSASSSKSRSSARISPARARGDYRSFTC